MSPLAILGCELSTHESIVRMLLAVALGGAIGLEREQHGRSAGLRTHIMVCLGTTMAMVVSMQLYRLLPATMADSALRVDPTRIAAGILTGIGFIGAGAIMKLKSSTRGLTTAACIWFVAALGVVIGVGAYPTAAAGTLLALGVLMLLTRFEHRLRPNTYREIIVVAAQSDELFAQVKAVFDGLGMTVQSYEYEDELEKRQIRAVFNVKFPRAHLGEETLRRLREIPGVRVVGWRAVAT